LACEIYLIVTSPKHRVQTTTAILIGRGKLIDEQNNLKTDS